MLSRAERLNRVWLVLLRVDVMTVMPRYLIVFDRKNFESTARIKK